MGAEPASSVVPAASRARRGHAAAILTLGGVLLIGLGLYFVLLRPPLLPEDARYMGTSLAHIQEQLPGLLRWLPRVFTVLGGHMISSGLLTCYLAQTALRHRAPGAALVAALSGLASIGLMVAVNFIIDSDFKWTLLVCTVPWPLSLWLYYREGTWTQSGTS